MDIIEKRDFRREKLLEKYTAKMFYRWNNRKFEKEYLRKLEKNWQRWKLVSLKKNLERRIINSISFLIFILFSTLFSILNLELGVSVMSYMTVTNCHIIQSQVTVT